MINFANRPGSGLPSTLRYAAAATMIEIKSPAQLSKTRAR
jgi:hypothetical protein